MKPNSLTACAAALLSLSLAGGLLAQERAPKKAQKKTEAAQRAPKAIPAPAAPAVQKARVVPMGLGAGREEEAKEEDPEAALLGTLLLPESANLNRILGRAADFFARDQWEEGCEVLQDLLEGRAIEAGPEQLDDPAYSVYSEDLRLYIPFTRYCQRLLCTLPPEGLEVYRLRVDAKAKEALNAARETMDVGALARAVELYFATSHGPELVMLLAELATLRAEIERALHLRSRLLIDYPDLSEELRRSIRIRQLHGLALLGEGAAFAEEHARLLALEPEGSTRIAGELVPFDKLPEHPAFRIRESYERRDAVAAELPLGTLQLMPLWEFELNDQDPYGISHKKSNNNNVFFSSSRGGLEVPARKSFRPGLRLLPRGREGREADPRLQGITIAWSCSMPSRASSRMRRSSALRGIAPRAAGIARCTCGRGRRTTAPLRSRAKAIGSTSRSRTACNRARRPRIPIATASFAMTSRLANPSGSRSRTRAAASGSSFRLPRCATATVSTLPCARGRRSASPRSTRTAARC
jgi:hypothetical protein